MKVSVQGFAEQLEKLWGLEELALAWVQFRYHPDVHMTDEVEPLVQRVLYLTGQQLRSVSIRGLTLSAAQEHALQQALGPGFDYQAGRLNSDSSYIETSDMEGSGWSDGYCVVMVGMGRQRSGMTRVICMAAQRSLGDHELMCGSRV
jgi:hypothetical protein